MSTLHRINREEDVEITLAEHAAKDLIAVGNALAGLLGLHQGGVVVGMPASQYKEAIQSLVKAAAGIGNEALQEEENRR